MSVPAFVAAIAAAVALLLGAVAPTARADGDPASDVLASQSVFLPQDAGVAATEQVRLAALVWEAARAGFPLRVAIVASQTDLGSVTELWNQPGSYARFLGEELGLVYHGPLLVVMPAGYGLVNVTRAGATPDTLGLPGAPAPGRSLGPAALTAVSRIAAAHGHTLAVPQIAVANHTSASSLTPWLVFAAGLVVVLAAWGASLRAQPPRWRAHRSAPAPPAP